MLQQGRLQGAPLAATRQHRRPCCRELANLIGGRCALLLQLGSQQLSASLRNPCSCWRGRWDAAASPTRSPCLSGWRSMRCRSSLPTVSLALRMADEHWRVVQSAPPACSPPITQACPASRGALPAAALILWRCVRCPAELCIRPHRTVAEQAGPPARPGKKGGSEQEEEAEDSQAKRKGQPPGPTAQTRSGAPTWRRVVAIGMSCMPSTAQARTCESSSATSVPASLLLQRSPTSASSFASCWRWRPPCGCSTALQPLCPARSCISWKVSSASGLG